MLLLLKKKFTLIVTSLIFASVSIYIINSLSKNNEKEFNAKPVSSKLHKGQRYQDKINQQKQRDPSSINYGFNENYSKSKATSINNSTTLNNLQRKNIGNETSRPTDEITRQPAYAFESSSNFTQEQKSNRKENSIQKNQDTQVGVPKKNEDTSTEPNNQIINKTKKDTGSTGGFTAPVIKGRIPPLIGLIATYNSSIVKGAYAGATSCTNPRITLFDIETMSVLADNPISQDDLEISTVFNFSPSSLNLDVQVPTKYLLKTSGCDVSYERIVTSYYSEQNLTPTTTLVSKIIKSSAVINITELNSAKIENLITKIDASINPTDDIDTSYNVVENDSSYQLIFQDAFGGENYQVLADSAPDLHSIVVPNTIAESAASIFSVDASHWNPLYEIGYEWYIDGVKLSNDANWAYTPSANSKRSLDIKVFIGESIAGTGSDVSRVTPYIELDYTISTTDDVITQAPNIALDASSTNPSNTKSIFINMNTGADLGSYFQNCESFSYFAITQASEIPSVADFTQSCTTANSQIVPFTTTLPDGDIDINIWAMDINGVISVKKSFTLNIDTEAPLITIASLNSSYRADTVFDLEWSVIEANQNSANEHVIEFFDGTTWTTLPNVASGDGFINNQIFQTTHLLPNIQATGAKFRISLTDSLGNTSVEESATFSITKPVLAINPTSYAFADVLNKATGSTNTFTISNNGNADTKDCSLVALSGTNASEFEITTDNCNTTNISASSSCDFVIRPAPTSKGSKSATATWTCGLDSIQTNITFSATNNIPVAPNNYSISTNEDSALNFTANSGSDIDSDILTYTITAAPTNGTLTNCMASDIDVSCTYTPNANFNGVDTFSYKVNDGTSDSANLSTVTITVVPVNDAPTLTPTQTINVTEDIALNFNLNPGSDIDGVDTLTYIITQTPAAGTLSCTGGTSTSCTYTPAPDDIGTYTFKYKVNDGTADSNEAVVTVVINNTNDAPVMVADQTISTNEDTAVNFTLNGATDIDPAQSLSYKVITPPTNGVLSNCITTSSYLADLTCTYTPNLNFNGTDSFTYRANDSIADSNTFSTVTITVVPVNDAPTLTTPQSFATNEDTALNFNLGLGVDVEGDTLSYIKLTNPASGTLNCTGGTSRACTYTPALNFNGAVSFTYKVNDGALDSNTATVNISVNAVNDAPTLTTPQSYATNEDTVLNFNLGLGVDVEGDTLSYIKLTNPASGTLTCTGGTSRACTYTPALNFNGAVSFTYKVNDGNLDSNTATVNITVNPVNDAPTLTTPQSFATNEDTVLNFNLGLGSDIDGDTLTYIKLTNPASGTLTCTGATSRACTYTPALNFNGAVSFTYKVNDSALDSNTATVNITVNPINDRPVMAANQNFITDDNTAFNFTITNATDVDGDSLSYKIVSATTNGTISNCIVTGTYGTDLTCTYTSNANFNGTDSFTYIANDGSLDAAAVATITFTVNDKTPPSAPPIILAHSQYRNVMGQNLTATSCSDIAAIYINESTQPTAGAAGWQTCTTTVAAITYTLASATQTTHPLKAWSKDIYGNVSTTATTLNVIYDITAPSISVTNPGLQRGNNTINVGWNVTELNISTSQLHTVQYYNGATATWVNITTTKAASAGPLSASAFTQSWTTPTLNRSDVKLRVILTDLAGNQTTSDSTVFTIDSTAPNLAFSTPAANTYHQSSVTVTGVCESGLDINFSGNIPATFAQTCSGGTFSQLVNFDSGDGNKTITISQTDAAGNITTVSRIFIRDEIAPILTKTSGITPDFTKNNQPNTWGGTCEGNYTIYVTGSQTTSFACSSGTWSWTAGSKTVDGTYSYNLVQTDGAGNTSSPPLSLSWQRDATPPVFNATSPVSIATGATTTITNNLNTFTISGNCEGTNTIVVSSGATDAFSCSSSSWSWTVPTTTTDGTRTFIFTQSDSAGNTSTFTMNHTRDTTGPALTIATNIIKNNDDTITFNGGCETGLTVNVTGAQTSSTTCPSGTWSWTSATQTTDATRNYTFAQSFTVAPYNTTSVSGQWIRETNLPTISLFSTSAANPSRSAFIPVDLNATSQNSLVYLKSFCIKSDDSTAPALTDSCWLDVNSPAVGKSLAQTIILDEFSNLLGWVPKTYNVYVWVKDEAENISALSNAGAGTLGVDKFVMGYDPGIPPTVWDVLAANTPSASLPPTRAQSSAPAGNDVYIRWKASDNLALPSGSITLYYTPDEINFTQITTGLDNANYGCTGYTLTANEGCYKWTGGSPLNSTYKIQVKVTDAGEISTQLVSNIINSDMIKIIAGNTESGLGGSAQTAMFFTRKSGSESDPGTLVVSNDGRFYIADYKRGIITIDPNDGKQKVFIPGTGTSSGDGGPAVNATLRYATKIALDYQGRLLILDTDRIRRVDLNQSTPSIETIIGGGADTSATVANALDVKIYAHSTNSWTARGVTLFSTPNGDIYFQSEYGLADPGTDLRVRVYKSATGQVISKTLTGIGDSYDATVNLTNCRLYNPGLRFDPSNSQITAVSAVSYHHYSYTNCDNNPTATDGDRYTYANFDPVTFEAITPNLDTWAPYLYYFNQTKMDGNVYRTIYRDYVNRVNFDGTYTRIIGSGTRGYCVDGTPAATCNMDIQDMFITPTGKIYVLEGGQIRTVDENGEMVTLFGQRRSYGDGVNALNARFDTINSIFRLNNGKYIVGDSSSLYFKEFTTEGNINIIAGTGNFKNYPDTTTLAKDQGLYDTTWVSVDKVTGDIFARAYAYGEFQKLNRASGYWENIIGIGGTETYNYWSADAQPGNLLISNGNQSYGLVLGYDGQNVLISRMKYNNTDSHWEDFMFKLYDSSDSYRQSHLAGTNGTETYTGGYNGICASGSLASTCKVPYYAYIGMPYWDSTNTRWIFTQNRESTDTGRNIFSVVKGGNITQISRLGRRALYGYTYTKVGAEEFLYYCYDNGIIYKHNLTTDTDLGALTWPTPNLYCRGLKMEYNSTNNSLVFPFEQNGLFGVAEYFLP